MRFEKIGRIFDPREHPQWWLHEFAQAPATLILEDRVRVYSSGRPRPDAQGQYTSYTGFVDLARDDLTRIIRVSSDPIMSLGDLGCFDEHGVYPVSVIRGADGKTVFCYYAGWSRKVSTRFDTAIGMAVSADGGETFSRLSNGPTMGANSLDPFVISGPKVRRFGNKLYMFYIGGARWLQMGGRAEPVYKIRSAWSQTGFDWSRYGANLIPDVLGPDEVQSGPDVHFADGRYHMYFCYRQVGHRPGREGGLRIGYAWSDDLIAWARDDTQAGIGLSDEGWDSEHIRYPHVFELDGEWWMLYNGNEFGRYGFGLARRVE